MNCKFCSEPFDLKHVNRVYGKNSMVSILGFCTAICYTHSLNLDKKISTNTVIHSSLIEKVCEKYQSQIKLHTESKMPQSQSYIAAYNLVLTDLRALLNNTTTTLKSNNNETV